MLIPVAVIKLETRLTGVDTLRVNSGCNTPCNGDELDAYGFGRTSDGGSSSPVLKTLETDYVGCGSTLAYLLVFANDDEGVCQGDSGGPLVNSNGVQVGVASFVQGGCAKGMRSIILLCIMIRKLVDNAGQYLIAFIFFLL